MVTHRLRRPPGRGLAGYQHAAAVSSSSQPPSFGRPWRIGGGCTRTYYYYVRGEGGVGAEEWPVLTTRARVCSPRCVRCRPSVIRHCGDEPKRGFPRRKQECWSGGLNTLGARTKWSGDEAGTTAVVHLFRKRYTTIVTFYVALFELNDVSSSPALQFNACSPRLRRNLWTAPVEREK